MRTVILVLMLTIAGLAHADPLAELRQYYNETATLQGRFIQTTLDESDYVLDESEGQFWIARPDKFRWDYQTPLQQVLVADGEALWMHDVELEQVTVRPLSEVLGAGPAVLLSGTYQDIEDAFEIVPLEDNWVQLKVKSEQWDFQEVLIQWQDGIPVNVVVDSGLGQRTVLQLADVQSNIDIPAARFRFDPPAGVDVIDSRGQ